MDKEQGAVTQVTLKLIGEGYQILTAEGLLPCVEYVDWVDEEGAQVEATLEDDTVISGPGSAVLAVVWYEDAEAVTAADLAAAPPLAGITRRSGE